MSRLEEVIDAEQAGMLPVLARTLAAEVDARDEVIAKLLAMLKPGGKPVREKLMEYDEYMEEIGKWHVVRNLHARACEIAGRTE